MALCERHTFFIWKELHTRQHAIKLQHAPKLQPEPRCRANSEAHVLNAQRHKQKLLLSSLSLDFSGAVLPASSFQIGVRLTASNLGLNRDGRSPALSSMIIYLASGCKRATSAARTTLA